MRKIILGFIFFATCLSIPGCIKDRNPVSAENQNIVKVTLQNQSDYSGIMVKIVELDTFVITDSTGAASLGNSLPDDVYTLEVRYPYFTPLKMDVTIENSRFQTPVKCELEQQMQFWVAPAETTISMSNLGDPYFFSLSGFRQYRVNITNVSINMGTYLMPWDVWALIPQGFEWPYIPNVDSIPDLCYLNYGWLGGNDAITNIVFTFQPGDTSSTLRVGSSSVLKDCFRPATYLLYSAVSDLGHYPEYFDPSYVRDDENPTSAIYDQMNRSLIKKKELFRPAIIHLKN